MSRTPRPLAALAIVAMAALISTGCGTGSSRGTTTGADHQDTGAGTRSDNRNAATAPAGTGSSGGNTSASAHGKAVKFAECMRDNGVSQFPDPDASGRLTIDGVVNGSSLDPSSSAWKQAVDACQELEPPGFTGSRATPEQMRARLEFAQCIRDNGVKDFPDPSRDGPLVDTNRIPSTATNGGMSMLNAAMQKCRSFASRAGVRGSQ